jgi:hypothetical protein
MAKERVLRRPGHAGQQALDGERQRLVLDRVLGQERLDERQPLAPAPGERRRHHIGRCLGLGKAMLDRQRAAEGLDGLQERLPAFGRQFGGAEHPAHLQAPLGLPATGTGLFSLGLRQWRGHSRRRSVTEQGTAAARGALDEAGLGEALEGLGHVPVHDLQVEGRERIPLSGTRDLPM